MMEREEEQQAPREAEDPRQEEEEDRGASPEDFEDDPAYNPQQEELRDIKGG